MKNKSGKKVTSQKKRVILQPEVMADHFVQHYSDLGHAYRVTRAQIRAMSGYRLLRDSYVADVRDILRSRSFQLFEFGINECLIISNSDLYEVAEVDMTSTSNAVDQSIGGDNEE